MTFQHGKSETPAAGSGQNGHHARPCAASMDPCHQMLQPQRQEKKSPEG